MLTPKTNLIFKKHTLICLLNIIFIFTNVKAQLCQGSLGDPIVNITFGNGSNPGPMLPAVTGYQYVSTDCPADGFYTVRNSTNGCFGNTWHTLTKDHTGDPNGYFMLVNASLQPSEFYLDTVKALCGNTTYEFAAWVLNILKATACGGAGTIPNLTFKIERTNGVLLQSYNTGNISPSSTPDWKQVGFFFTTPSNVSDIVLRITNNALGGCGNDIALDDITFRPCGPLLTPTFSNIQGNTKNLCEGDNAQVSISCNVSAGYNSPSFQWQQSLNNSITWTDIIGETSTTLIRNFTSAVVGNYQYRLSAAEAGNMNITLCRITSQALTVQVNAKPTTSTSNNSPICENQSLHLSATGGSQYLWFGPNNFSATIPSPTINNVGQTNAGKYYVIVTDNFGCFKTDSATVIIDKKPQITALPTSTDLCEKDSIQLNASGGIFYEWQPIAGLSNASIAMPKASPTDTTQYLAIASSQNGCKDTTRLSVNIIKKPMVNAGANAIIIEGQSVQLLGTITGNYQNFFWSPNWQIDNTTLLQPTVHPLQDTFYVLNIIAINGCGIVTDTVNIKVYKKIIVPNAFSPNGDGINETWNIDALIAYPYAEVQVFDRNGSIVFSKTNYNKPWDGKYNGKPLPIGTYYYTINLKEIGSSILSGWVMLVK